MLLLWLIVSQHEAADRREAVHGQQPPRAGAVGSAAREGPGFHTAESGTVCSAVKRSVLVYTPILLIKTYMGLSKSLNFFKPQFCLKKKRWSRSSPVPRLL